MNSTLADSASMISTSTRMIRRNESHGKLRPRVDFYLWLGGHMHAKRLLISLQLLLFIVGLRGLVLTADPHFSVVSIPGLDGKPLFGQWGPSSSIHRNGVSVIHDGDSTIVQERGNEIPTVNTVASHLTDESYAATVRRNILSILSYLYISSVILSLLCLRWVERAWMGSGFRIQLFNPALFLTPFLFSMLSFAVPLMLWSIRTVRVFLTQNCFIRSPAPTVVSCSSMAFIWDTARFVVVPSLIIWSAYLYLIYGCALAFVYVWRRSVGEWKTKDQAAASFSWSFRDRNTLLGLKNSLREMGDKSATHGGFTRNGPGRSWRSTKSTDRPTLRSYTSRPNDLNESRASLLSGCGDTGSTDNISQNGDDICINIDNPQQSPRSLGINSHALRRSLDTVVEEVEVHEGTMGSGASRV